MSSPKFLKLLSIFLCLILIVSLSVGCSPVISNQSPVLIKEFECDIRVASRGREYLCSLKRTDERTTLRVNEPHELSGLELGYSSGVYSVRFKELTMSLDDSKAQLTQHFADGLIKVLDKTLSLKEISVTLKNGVWVYDGETTCGEFEISFDKGGHILGLKIPRLDTQISFENFVEI